MKIMIVTDAWFPQVNGVVTTMSTMAEVYKQQGHDVMVLEPSSFKTFPLPSYPEIRLPIDVWKVGAIISEFRPDKLHIVTEGTLGLAARLYMSKNGLEYTSAFHTKFPEYANERWPFLTIPFGYSVMRAFHSGSQRVMVATESVREELQGWRFDNVITWSRGVNTDIFQPLKEGSVNPLVHLKGKKYLYVGRIAPEKNIEDFLNLDLNGYKIVVGDGPSKEALQEKYPEVLFVGYKKGKDLAAFYAASDVMVFPSKTDTYGVVMLESMACGTPVAAYPVSGPKDVVKQGETGCMHDDLGIAISACESIDTEKCLSHARGNDWLKTASFLLDNMAVINWKPFEEKQEAYKRKTLLSKMIAVAIPFNT